MRNKPLLLCFSVFGFFCLMFFPYCYWLRNGGCDFFIVLTGHKEEKWFRYLLEEAFSLNLKVERLVWKMPHLSTQKKMRCPPFDDQLLCNGWGFSLESSNALAENSMLIEDSSSPWLVLPTSVHRSPLGHGFMRLYQVTHLRLPVTPSQEGHPLCLTLLLPKGIYPNPPQES